MLRTRLTHVHPSHISFSSEEGHNGGRHYVGHASRGLEYSSVVRKQDRMSGPIEGCMKGSAFMDKISFLHRILQENLRTSENRSGEGVDQPEPRRVEREGRCIHGNHAIPAAGHREGQALLQALQGVPMMHEGLHVAQGQPIHVPRHPEVVELQLLRLMHHLHVMSSLHACLGVHLLEPQWARDPGTLPMRLMKV